MNYVIVINKNGMGVAEESLSHTLIKNFLNLLTEETVLPHAILLYAEGVKLVSIDSPVLDELKILEEKKIKIIACKTCLNYYKLHNIEVGMAGTMQDIINYQVQAEKVMTL